MKIEKSYKELVKGYFNLLDYQIGENAPKLTKQLQKLVLNLQ